MAVAVGGLRTGGTVVVMKKSKSDFNGNTYHTLEIGGMGFSCKASCSKEQYDSVSEEQEVEFVGKFKPKATENGNIMKLEILQVGAPGTLKKAA